MTCLAYNPELQELELKLEKLHDLAVLWTEKRFPEATKTERRITILAAINAMIELEKIQLEQKKDPFKLLEKLQERTRQP